MYIVYVYENESERRKEYVGMSQWVYRWSKLTGNVGGVGPSKRGYKFSFKLYTKAFIIIIINANTTINITLFLRYNKTKSCQ